MSFFLAEGACEFVFLGFDGWLRRVSRLGGLRLLRLRRFAFALVVGKRAAVAGAASLLEEEARLACRLLRRLDAHACLHPRMGVVAAIEVPHQHRLTLQVAQQLVQGEVALLP